jgi:hypothetical protein
VEPPSFVDELRAQLLSALLRAFDGRPPHEMLHFVLPEAITGPTTAIGAARQPSQANLPVLTVALLAAEIDLPAALALGLATGYRLDSTGEGEGPAVDLMVSAEYPFVPGLGQSAEVASVAPWPPLFDPITQPPAGLASTHGGPIAPPRPDQGWTTVVSTSWDRVRPTLTLDRPVAAAHGRFDPAAIGAVESLLEERPSGGPRPLAITRLPDQADRVGVADRDVPLPDDATVGSSGHAISVCDAFGVWSQWREAVVDLPPAPMPIPLPTNARAEATFEGTPVCDTKVSVDILVDGAADSPHFVQVRGWLLPAPFAGAPVPAGLSPSGGAPPPGAVELHGLLRSSGGSLVPEPAGSLVVEELPEDGGNGPLPAVPGPRRRWGMTLRAVALDFGATAHWTLALWAREIVSAGWTPDGGPALTSVSSPVPPTVTVVRPPVPPMGSAPDAEGRSHVEVPLPSVPGASRIILWTLAETTLLPAALTAPFGQPAPSLADRYAVLRRAVNDAGGARRRFTRVRELSAGTTRVDVPLPRGSREIHLFAVTAVNPANVESAWPSNAEGMWAAVAPEVVVPSPPVVTALIGKAGDVTVTVTARSVLQVASMPLHATRSWEGARDVGSMGPPLAAPIPSVAADPPPVPDTPTHPAGSRWEASVVLPRVQVEGWRGLHLRAVARPVPSDPERGLLGADSAPSEVVTVTVPPLGTPDLSALTAATWGSPPDGVVVRFDCAAPLGTSPWGPHTLAARAVGPDLLVDLPEAPVGMIPVDGAEPPATAVSAPLLVRTGPAVGGRFPFALWFRRPDRNRPVDVTVRLSDPLGGVSVDTLTVPPVSALLPPTITTIDPDNGRPGDTFTIFGTNFLLDPGDTVSVLFVIPTEPDAPPNPGPLTIVGNPTPTTIVAIVPPMPREVRLPIVVSRSDGAEAFSEDEFFVTLL